MIWPAHTHAGFAAAHDQDIMAGKLCATFVLRRVQGFSFQILNAGYERYVWLYMKTFDSKLASVSHVHPLLTCANGHMRAVEDALFVIALSVHILDSVSPLRVRGLLERCDARDWTSQLDMRTKCEVVDVSLKVLNILR